MNTSAKVRSLIARNGIRQNRVVNQMNRIAPKLNMTRAKFSAIVCGGRKMTGDERIVFCMAIKTNPDYFCVVAATESI